MAVELQRPVEKPMPNVVGRSAVLAAAFGAAAVISLVTLALLCLARTVELGDAGGDFVAILDGGYRISQGQWPHIDFAVPHGAWPLVQGWLALKLAPVWAPFLTYQATQWLTVLPAALYLAAGQPTPLRACALLIVVAVATLVPYVFDFLSLPGLDYFAGYNRLNTALLFLVFIWAAGPRRRTWADTFVISFLLFAMLMTKIPGFIVAVGVVAVVACLSSVKRTLALRAAALLIGVLILLQVTTALPGAYFTDIRAMLAINKGGIVYALLSTAMKSAEALVALVLLFLSVLPRRKTTDASPRGARVLVWLRAQRAPLLVIVMTVAAFAMESQAFGSLLLVAVSALLFVPLPRRAGWFVTLPVARAAIVFAILGPWFGGALYNGMTVAMRQIPQNTPDVSLQRLLPHTVTTRENLVLAAERQRVSAQADPPNNLLVAQSPQIYAYAFVALVQSVDAAANAAQRQGFVGAGTSVMTVGEVDYFARILGARSPKGINLWQHVGRTFDTPPVSELRHYLRNVSAAFMRRCDDDETFSTLNGIFQPALEADFVRHDLTPCWAVWTRKPGA